MQADAMIATMKSLKLHGMALNNRSQRLSRHSLCSMI